MSALHREWINDQADQAAQRAQHSAAQAHALRHPSPEAKRAAQRVRDTLRDARLARDLDRYAKEHKTP